MPTHSLLSFHAVVKVNGAKGRVTARIMVPQDAKEPFVWHAYIAPADAIWPNNVLASTNFTAPMGAKTTTPCAPLRNAVRDPTEPADFNYVVVSDTPNGFKTGAKAPVAVQYNLLPSESTYVSATLHRTSDNTVVASQQLQAETGEHYVKMMLDVPADAGTEPVYLMAMLKPAGKAFSERVAEDRVYSVGLYNGRRHLLRTEAGN